MAKKISAINPGHGGADECAVGSGLSEKLADLQK